MASIIADYMYCLDTVAVLWYWWRPVVLHHIENACFVAAFMASVKTLLLSKHLAKRLQLNAGTHTADKAKRGTIKHISRENLLQVKGHIYLF